MGIDLFAKGGLCWEILQHFKLDPTFQFSFLVGVAVAVLAGHGRAASFDVFVIEKNNQRAGEQLSMKCLQNGLQARLGNVRPPETGEACGEISTHVSQRARVGCLESHVRVRVCFAPGDRQDRLIDVSGKDGSG